MKTYLEATLSQAGSTGTTSLVLLDSGLVSLDEGLHRLVGNGHGCLLLKDGLGLGELLRQGLPAGHERLRLDGALGRG